MLPHHLTEEGVMAVTEVMEVAGSVMEEADGVVMGAAAVEAMEVVVEEEETAEVASLDRLRKLLKY